MVHRCGLQRVEASSCDPMVHAHPDLDRTVDIVSEFDKDSWARSDGPNSIHRMIQWLKIFLTLNRRLNALINDPDAIQHEIRWLSSILC